MSTDSVDGCNNLTSCFCSIWHWLHDIFRLGVRTILGTGAKHELSQRPAGTYAGYTNGVHIHTDVLHLSKQRGSVILFMDINPAK